MEISSVDSGDSILYPNAEPEWTDWEKVGRTSLLVFSFIAALAFIPASVKKRQYISSPLTNIAPSPEPIVEPEERPLLPAPRCTRDEKGKVEDIFKTVAEGGTNLYLFGFRLIQVGNEIDHVHPFSFLLAAPREYLRTIFFSGSDFKIANVMKGIKKGMEREYARNNLERYIPDFAAAFGKAPERVKQLIRARSWRSLVHYLFEINVPHEE